MSDSELFDQTENLFDSVGSTPIFLGAPKPKLLANICFRAGTLVSTDQGEVKIELLDLAFHTFRGKPLIALTRTISPEKHLVLVPKDALKPNVPSRDTYVTLSHRILLKNKMVEAIRLVNKIKTVKLVPYTNEVLYNVLLDVHSAISVQNMTCESLDPTHRVAKFYKAVAERPEIEVALIKAMNKQFLIERASAQRSRIA